MKKRGVKDSYNKIIMMDISAALYGVPKQMINTVYTVNDFTLKKSDWKRKGQYPPKYLTILSTEYINPIFFNEFNNYHKSVFYYKYNGWNIIITSNLSIKMPNVSKIKAIKIYFNEDKHYIKLYNNKSIFYFFGGFMNLYQKISDCKKEKVIEYKCETLKFN